MYTCVAEHHRASEALTEAQLKIDLFWWDMLLKCQINSGDRIYKLSRVVARTLSMTFGQVSYRDIYRFPQLSSFAENN